MYPKSGMYKSAWVYEDCCETQHQWYYGIGSYLPEQTFCEQRCAQDLKGPNLLVVRTCHQVCRQIAKYAISCTLRTISISKQYG